MKKLFLSFIAIGLFGTLQAYQSEVVVSYNDSIKNAPTDWWMLDPDSDLVPGISTDKAYEFLEGRQSQTVVVAVIDSGIDIDHEDLKDIIWTNTDEIAGNGIDDDKNGYIDDVHGWNFLGGKDGNSVKFDRKFAGWIPDEAALRLVTTFLR